MSYVKGSQLPSTSTVADTDTLIVTQEGDSKTTKKVAKSDLLKEDRTRLTNLETDNTTNKSNIKNLQKSLENKAPEKYILQFEGAISSNFRKKIIGTTDVCGFVKSFRKNDSSDACMPPFGAGIAWGQVATHAMLYADINNPVAYISAGNNNKLNWYKQIAWKDDLISKDITVLFERNNGTINKNINTCFNSSEGVFTAPSTGQYLVMCSGYELSNSNMYVACVVGGENSNRNELYTTGSSGFTLITLSVKQTLKLYEAPAGNINSTCISSNSAVNMLIARIK